MKKLYMVQGPLESICQSGGRWLKANMTNKNAVVVLSCTNSISC